jgi:phosphonate transport system substrate-binding protein
MKIKNNALWIICVAALLGPIEAFADLTLGVFPRRPAASTHKAFKPLADKLQQELGEKVNLVVAKDFKSFWKQVAANQFDIVHFNQYHYIKSHKEFGYKVIAANEEFGGRQIAGSLSVRKDSGIKTVADLRGKTILFGGGTKAMGSYIAPTSVLKKAGLEAGRDYKVSFAKNPPSAVIGVYHKAANAAGSGNVVLKISAVTKKIKADDMKLLVESEPFVQLPWAVKSSMSDDKAKKIQQVMTSLKNSEEGRAILKAAKVTNFFAVTDKDYNKVRDMTKFAVGEEY